MLSRLIYLSVTAMLVLGMVSAAMADGPVIVSLSPTQNALNVSPTTSITVTFDADMDETSFTDATFLVSAGYTGRHFGTFSYNNAAKTITFTPDDAFPVGDVVTVTLTTGITSDIGDPLDRAYGWSFTVEVVNGLGQLEAHGSYAVNNIIFDYFMLPGDFDGDGDIDLVADKLDSLLLLTNDGSAVFSRTAQTCPEDIGLDNARSPVAADFNNDGYLDLATPAPAILLNDGTGTFTVDSVYGDYVAYHLCCADVDNDGAVDVVLSQSESGIVSVFRNIGDGTLAPPTDYTVDPTGISVIIAADFDNDLDVDLAVSITDDKITILLNDGTGVFATGGPEYTTDPLYRMHAADMNGDGYADIVINTPNVDIPSYLSLLINNGDGTFAPSAAAGSVDAFLSFTSIVDFDADGRLDLAGLNMSAFKQDALTAFFLWNNGAGSLLNYEDVHLLPYFTGGKSTAGVFADLDGDLDIDLACKEWEMDGGAVYIHLNQEAAFICGDANADGDVNVGDAVYLVNYTFRYGIAPKPLAAGNVNCDDEVNVGDGVYLINFVFKDGPAPCADCQ